MDSPAVQAAIRAFPTRGPAAPRAVPRPDALEGYLEFALRVVKEQPSELNLAFFGPRNLEYLQTRIRDDVRRLSGHVIGRQSDQDLVAIMAAVYTNADVLMPLRGLSTEAQLRKLDNAVLRECVRQCIDGISAMSGYIRDASTNATPLARPINPSVKGDRVLPGLIPL